MSIAFQALVLFAIILPGIVLRKRMSTAGMFRQPRTLTDELAQSLIYATLAHAAWIPLCGIIPGGRPVNLKVVLLLALGQFGANQNELAGAINAFEGHGPRIVVYFVSLTLATALLGTLLRWSADRWRPFRDVLGWIEDREPGEERARDWKNFLKVTSDKRPESGTVVLLTTVIELGKTAWLYVGRLEHTIFRPDGDPEGFVLSQVSRRPLTDADGHEPDPGQGHYHDIEGDRFVVRLSETRTLNILMQNLDSIEIDDAGTELTSPESPPTTPHTES